MPKRVYWDSCTFLGLINQEPDKLNDSAGIWKEAERGNVIIYTSFFTFTEVFRARCEGLVKPLSEEEDKKIEAFLRQAWVRPIIVDELIAIAARRLMRQHPQCKKPSDGIHLATALRLNVDEMHTFDGSDLLGLTGKINRSDWKPLIICKPTPPPPPPPKSDGPLFEREEQMPAQKTR